MANLGTAVVTGASAGIGASYAKQLDDRGYGVVVVARRRHRLEELAAQLDSAEVLVADLATAEGVARVAERLTAPDVTLLVNNAGINGYGSFAQVDPDVLASVVTLNVDAPMRLARAVLPGMLERDRGAIVNVASLLAFSGSVRDPRLPRRATYAASKAFLVAFSRVLATEVVDSRVRVQVVCPGYTATEFHLTNDNRPVEDERASAKGPEPYAMSADDVVRASLLSLDRGETVCVPGLDDPSVVDRLIEAEAGLRRGSRPHLADRYA